MAPGFALLLAVIMSATIAPLVAATGIGLLFFNQTRPYAKIIFLGGGVGGCILLAGILSAAAFFNRQSFSVEAMAIMFGAGFSIAAVGAIVCRWLVRR
jgi:hypothetical protein